jgi:hypothetical protein
MDHESPSNADILLDGNAFTRRLHTRYGSVCWTNFGTNKHSKANCAACFTDHVYAIDANKHSEADCAACFTAHACANSDNSSQTCLFISYSSD